ncbi:MAG: hypothetical protein IT426_07690 [Pirellulales bacterium]|nr:hypothetical protein [Pirellulales bacterium]
MSDLSLDFGPKPRKNIAPISHHTSRLGGVQAKRRKIAQSVIIVRIEERIATPFAAPNARSVDLIRVFRVFRVFRGFPFNNHGGTEVTEQPDHPKIKFSHPTPLAPRPSPSCFGEKPLPDTVARVKKMRSFSCILRVSW